MCHRGKNNNGVHKKVMSKIKAIYPYVKIKTKCTWINYKNKHIISKISDCQQYQKIHGKVTEPWLFNYKKNTTKTTADYKKTAGYKPR